MGEYAKYNGQQIKIGTCEDMLYLRADQAHLVEAIPNSLDPIAKAEHIRFRFPFPWEDDIEPGQFTDPDFSYPIWGAKVPDCVDHYSVQFRADNGYLVSLPCPESNAEQPNFIHRNGFGGAVKISQQRVWKGQLVTVAECGGCGAEYRLETLLDATPIIESLLEDANERNSDAVRQIALRIAAGYAMDIRPNAPLVGSQEA